MRRTTAGHLFSRLIVLIAVAAAGGCGVKATRGIHQSDACWTRSAADGVPGIDSASVTKIVLKAGPPEGLPFVVWSDLSNGNRGSGSSNIQGATYTGEHSGGNKKLPFKAQTTDGKTGTITIDGREFNLANGPLFLVSTQSDPARIQQLQFDVDQFPKDMDQLVKLANDTPSIREFFAVEPLPAEKPAP